jgi:hypothetical protein
MHEGCARRAEELLAVADPATILAPRHLTRVQVKVAARDMVVRALLGFTQAREEGLGHVRAGRPVAIAFRVVDPVRLIVGAQAIPG